MARRRQPEPDPVPTAFRLSRERQQELRRVQRQIHDVLPTLDVAEACGLDCQQARDDLAFRQQQIGDILAALGTPEYQ